MGLRLVGLDRANRCVAFALLVGGLAACVNAPEKAGPEGAIEGFPRGVHPYPSGDEWPEELQGPFEGEPRADVWIPAHDGVLLRGWLFRPSLPEGIRAPVIIQSTPYHGLTDPDDPAMLERASFPIRLFVEKGYAALTVSVRGTGTSGGCFTNKGAAEQRDQADLVAWAAAQPWSSGRVGMMGLSYPGTTPFMAAVQAPPALKALVVMGPVTDPYTETYTPQGAMYTGGGTNDLYRRGLVGLASPIEGPVDYRVRERAEVQAERLCPELVRVLTATERGHFTDDRDPSFWDERRLITRFPQVTAAVLFGHGLHERDHPLQEDVAWEALAAAPKRMLLGPWGHQVPPVDEWTGVVQAWFDFWLKGQGPLPPGLGTVGYQDGAGTWHASSQWPPAERRDEVLYLTGGQLSPVAGRGDASFRSVPAPGLPGSAFCLPPVVGSAVPTSLVYSTAALGRAALISGNPFAYLRLSSDLQGGLVAVDLFDLAPDSRCDGAEFVGARGFSNGVADLRFHAGNLRGRDFPTGSPTFVRIDLENLAEWVPAGHRLAVVVSHGAPVGNVPQEFVSDDRIGRTGQPYHPTIALGSGLDPAASHLVLPFVDGGVEGRPPTLDYPPRPFVPESPRHGS